MDGNYKPFGGHDLVVGIPFYDGHYRYYYDGSATYRIRNPEQTMASSVGMLVTLVSIVIVVFIAVKNTNSVNYEGGEEFYQDITTTLVENHENTVQRC